MSDKRFRVLVTVVDGYLPEALQYQERLLGEYDEAAEAEERATTAIGEGLSWIDEHESLPTRLYSPVLAARVVDTQPPRAEEEE